MYAVFQSGGKQHRVIEGQIIRLEKLPLSKGAEIEFDQVMMIANDNNIQIGSPFVKDCKITAQVVAHGRGDKVMIIKFRRRKHFRKYQGHRQWFTDIKITSISSSILLQ
ncbi:50S ribosomal protein L21 [Candidatus Hoaglandella endobia]|uniref:Large ribosomal subunit protein bL21 n=1 Tax=Candidatus Hoaglandella endobia TaxID=1778263 RepID=A0A143WTK7_9ENTR|nr:50S ribosomal protein L21 [Candidatus Hoaglandella endobia]CUX97048.1 50S ribosomal protein L21 [Candidatus Hoaglandella endobia]